MTSELIRTLRTQRDLADEQFAELFESGKLDEELFRSAREIREEHYGRKIFIRGLIEVSNYCRNDCLYCGIRRSNRKVSRYRLTEAEILDCCRAGYTLGFRTFVLQGGEDPWFTDERLCTVISAIKREFPDCAVTLSLGERSGVSYRALFEAGADRYLLRHETASDEHYRKLHPAELDPAERRRCLWDLKEIGYQVGSGFMVGSPWQTTQDLIKDLRYLQELDPDMIGIGPFLHHQDTPLGDFPDGSVDLTLRLIAILRHLFPSVLLPSTTALGSLDPIGRQRGVLAGANVIMPNLSPADVRGKYEIYEKKLYTGVESAEGLDKLREEMAEIGYTIVTDRGDRAT